MPPVLPPTAIASYGADANGLICGYRFARGGAGQPLDSAAAAAWLAAPPADGSFVWLHVNLSVAASEDWLRRHGLPEGFFEALGGGSRSTRIERERDELLAVVNDVTFDFAFEPGDVATLWVAVGERRVVSARRQALRSVDRLRAEVNRGEALPSPLALLDHLLRDQADELQRLLRQATDRVDDIEDAVLAGRREGDGAELARLRRLMVRLQRLLAPEPGALLRLLGNPPRWVAAEDLQRLRDASEDFAVVLRDVATLQERVKLLQEEATSRMAMETNRILFLLTMVTVLALPINLIAGLMGMNVGGIPLAEHPHGFATVVAFVASVTGVAAWLVTRRLLRRR